MQRTTFLQSAALAALTLVISNCDPAFAAAPGELVLRGPTGTIVVPASSIVRPEDFGLRAHTNIRIFIPYGHPSAKNSSPSGKYENPASLACLYGVTKFVKGCNPETLTTVATGGTKAIALVDAFDYPTAANDLGV